MQNPKISRLDLAFDYINMDIDSPSMAHDIYRFNSSKTICSERSQGWNQHLGLLQLANSELEPALGLLRLFRVFSAVAMAGILICYNRTS